MYCLKHLLPLGSFKPAGLWRVCWSLRKLFSENLALRQEGLCVLSLPLWGCSVQLLGCIMYYLILDLSQALLFAYVFVVESHVAQAGL